MMGNLCSSIIFTIRNKFAALKNLENNGGINRAWGTCREHKNLDQTEYHHCELHHKPWFDKVCSKLVVQRKQDQSKVYEDNLSHVRQEASRHFRKNKWE
jgi:hypothetical protein